MYCPTSENEKGGCEKQIAGKANNAENVKQRWTKANIMAGFINTLKTSKPPIITSAAAKIFIDTQGAIAPKVSIEIVSVAKSSAGLSPWKNFKAPNHIKSTPILMRSRAILLAVNVCIAENEMGANILIFVKYRVIFT